MLGQLLEIEREGKTVGHQAHELPWKTARGETERRANNTTNQQLATTGRGKTTWKRKRGMNTLSRIEI